MAITNKRKIEIIVREKEKNLIIKEKKRLITERNFRQIKRIAKWKKEKINYVENEIYIIKNEK